MLRSPAFASAAQTRSSYRRTGLYEIVLAISAILILAPQPSWAQVVAAVLPSSRSVQVGIPATAFATIINAGAVNATDCVVAPVTSLPATFSFQTTNPATNQLIGTLNTAVNVAAGVAQSFVIGITPTAPFPPTDVELRFACSTGSASKSVGLNTLLLSASSTPVPDIVALAATLNNDGVVGIPTVAPTTGVFSVATVNVGVSGSITASADTGGVSVPVTVAICQTNPTTGDCLAPPSSSVATQIAANATPTFGVFVTGTDTVSFDPGNKRIFVRFQDAAGVTRGSTSVAVQTQAPLPKITKLTSAMILPTAGGLAQVKSDDSEVNGAALSVPARAVATDVLVSLGTAATLPVGSPFGQNPIGKVFSLEPSGVGFAEPATLSLPISPGAEKKNLHIAVFSQLLGTWQNLGGTIQGDFISTTITHQSLYGVFPSGKSTVQLVNSAVLDTTNTPIQVIYIGGPVPPPDTPSGSAFPVPRPLPPGGVEFAQGESRILELLPGVYHFTVSYLRPQPGVANSLFFRIPPLTAGADDGLIDQVITITDTGATSTDPVTNASIVFPGRTVVPGTNVRPTISCTAAVLPPSGPVPVTSGDPTGPLPSRIVNIGAQGTPVGIKLEAFQQGNPLNLIATPTDPEGAALSVFWTVRDPISGLGFADGQGTSSGTTINRLCGKDNSKCNFTRGGFYQVYATVYDNFGLFDECHWNINVVPNTPPTLAVIVDDVVIDFGRLDAAPNIPGPGQPDRRVLGVGPSAPGIADLCAYVGTPLSTVLKGLPAVPGSAPPLLLQNPAGMTCVFAVINDVDGDPLTVGFVLPVPIFGEGNVYAAVPIPPSALVPAGLPTGAALDNQLKLDAYNATLSARAAAGLHPNPFGPNGQLLAPGVVGVGQAVPIIFEAPDDPDPALSTNDCRIPTPQNTLPCVNPRGGAIPVEARVTDGFSPERKEFGFVVYPDPAIVFPSGVTLTATPAPPDPGPGQGVTVTGCIFPARAGVTINFSIVGTDGFTSSASPATGANGCADFFIPGGAEGVVDVVTITVPAQATVTSAVTANVTYTF